MAKGKKTGGRQAGTPNQFSRDLRAAILEAARKADPSTDVEAEKSLEGFLTWAAQTHGAAYVALLGKLLPSEVAATVNAPHFSKEHRDAIAAAYLRADT